MPNRSRSPAHKPLDRLGQLGATENDRHRGQINHGIRSLDVNRRSRRSRSRSTKRHQGNSTLSHSRPPERDINSHHSDRKFRNRSRSRSRGTERSKDKEDILTGARVKSEYASRIDEDAINKRNQTNVHDKVKEPNKDSKKVKISEENLNMTTQASEKQISKRRKLDNTENNRKLDNQSVSSHLDFKDKVKNTGKSTEPVQSTSLERNSFVEIVEVDSDEEERKKETSKSVSSDQKNKFSEVVITDLVDDISEPEIRMTISQSKVPRPEKLTILNCRSKSKLCKAILTFRTYQDAVEFKSKFKGKFMSKSVNIELENVKKKITKDETAKSPRKTPSKDLIKQESCHPVSAPSTSSKQLISVKSDSFLKASSTHLAVDDIGGGSPSLGGVSPPSGGVSPPRVSESDIPDITVEKLLSTLFAPKVEPVLVDIQCNDGDSISKIKVFLVNHRKCQQFFGKEPQILVGAFLRYVKKYYPTKENIKMILVTACIPAFQKFMKALEPNTTNSDMFFTFFDLWTDLNSITTGFLEKESKPGMPKAVQFDQMRLEKLLQSLNPTEVKKFDTVLMMKTILDVNPLFSTDGLKSFDPNKLLEYGRPCRLPDEKYLLVLVNVGIIELDIGLDGKMCPAIGTLGFRNSLKGSWFVPIKPERKEGKMITESATSLGFTLLGKTWVWGQEESSSCLGEKEALDCFVSTLQEEISTSKSSGVILLTPRNDLTLAVLISALTKYSLMETFLSIVKGVGSVEDLAVAENVTMNSIDLLGFEEYYVKTFKKKSNLSKPQNVPKILYQILESLLKSSPTYTNYYSQYVHPPVSPYTNNRMFTSKLPNLREGFYNMTSLKDHSFTSQSEQIIPVEIQGLRKHKSGQAIFILSMCGISFIEKTTKLGESCQVEVRMKNENLELVSLLQGQVIGIASLGNEFLFPDRSSFKPELKNQPPVETEDEKKNKEVKNEKKISPVKSLPKKKLNLPGMWPSSSNFSNQDAIINAHQSVRSVPIEEVKKTDKESELPESTKKKRRPNENLKTTTTKLKNDNIDADIPDMNHKDPHKLSTDCQGTSSKEALGAKSAVKRISESEVIELEDDIFKVSKDQSIKTTEKHKQASNEVLNTEQKISNSTKTKKTMNKTTVSDSNDEFKKGENSLPACTEIEVLGGNQTETASKKVVAKVTEVIELDIASTNSSIIETSQAERDIVEIIDEDEITEVSTIVQDTTSPVEVTTLSDSDDSEEISVIEVVPKKKESVKFMQNGCAYVDPTIIQRKIRDYMEKKKKVAEHSTKQKEGTEKKSKTLVNDKIEAINLIDNSGVAEKDVRDSGKMHLGAKLSEMMETENENTDECVAEDTPLNRLIEDEVLAQSQKANEGEKIKGDENIEVNNIEITDTNESIYESVVIDASSDILVEEEVQPKGNTKENMIREEINVDKTESTEDSDNIDSSCTLIEDPKDNASFIVEPSQKQIAHGNNLTELHPVIQIKPDKSSIQMVNPDKSSIQIVNPDKSSIQIVNPISVSATAPIVYAPLNQVNVSGEKRWTCDHCVKTYKHRRDLVEHINDHFQLYICPVCDKICNSKRNLKDHSAKFHKYNYTDDSESMLDSKIEIYDNEILQKDTETLEIVTEEDIEDHETYFNMVDVRVRVEVRDEFSESEIEKNIHELEYHDSNIDLEDVSNHYHESTEKETKVVQTNSQYEMKPGKRKTDKGEDSRIPKKRFIASSTSGRRKQAEFKEHATNVNTKHTETEITKSSFKKVVKRGVNISIINDVVVDNIVDLGKKDLERGKINLVSCKSCTKMFKTNKALITHIEKVHKSQESKETRKNNESEKEITSTSAQEIVETEAEIVEIKETSQIKNTELKKRPMNIENKTMGISYAKKNEPVVSQIEKVSKTLQNILISKDLDLSEDFSSLLTAPQFSDLIRTFIKFHQVPLDSLDYSQKMFADLLISEIVTADILDEKSLEAILVKIHKKDKTADIEAWKDYISAEIESISLASEVDRNFNLDCAIQIMILHCLPGLLVASSR